MFRTLLVGIMGASMIHAQAVKQCVTNDRLEDILQIYF